MDDARQLKHRHCFKCGRVAVFVWDDRQIEAKDILCDKCKKEKGA